MKCLCIVLLLASIAPTLSLAFAQENRPRSSSERTIFYADEESFKPSVPIPPKVLAKLVETEAGKEGLEFAIVSQKPNLADLFRAVEVHLNPSEAPALVVRGVGWMSGADNDWFWVVRNPQQQPMVILFCGANSLEILDSKSQGFRDIRCTWSSPSETVRRMYHFTEGRYKLLHERRSENTPTN